MESNHMCIMFTDSQHCCITHAINGEEPINNSLVLVLVLVLVKIFGCHLVFTVFRDDQHCLICCHGSLSFLPHWDHHQSCGETIWTLFSNSAPSFTIGGQWEDWSKIQNEIYEIQNTRYTNKKILNAKILNTKNKYEIQFSKYKKKLHLLKLQNNKMCSFTTGGQSLRCRWAACWFTRCGTQPQLPGSSSTEKLSGGWWC